jgi:hypothetical protein
LPDIGEYPQEEENGGGDTSLFGESGPPGGLAGPNVVAGWKGSPPLPGLFQFKFDFYFYFSIFLIWFLFHFCF